MSEKKLVKVAIDKGIAAKLDRLAKRERKKMATIVRSIIECAVDDRAFMPLAIEKELQTFVRLVRNVANNLNQLSHHANTIKRVLYEDAVFAELRRLEKHVKDYTAGRIRSAGDP